MLVQGSEKCSENPGREEASEAVVVRLRTSMARSAPCGGELREVFSSCDS